MMPTMTSTTQAHRGGCGLAARDNMKAHQPDGENAEAVSDGAARPADQTLKQRSARAAVTGSSTAR